MSGTFNLGSAGLVRLRGPDSRSFAQSQFCSDAAALPANDWQWSGWLDPKGRVRYFFGLIDAGDGDLFAWLPLGNAAAFAQELRRFVFRSKLSIEALEGWAVLGNFDSASGTPRLHRNGESLRVLIDSAQPRSITLQSETVGACDAEALKRWRGRDVADGLPLIDSCCAGEFVPQALDLERLGAISFRKGCYPGQEVAARLHFRGGNKRSLRRLRWVADGVQPVGGAKLIQASGSASVGSLLYTGGDEHGALGLAVLTDPEVSGEVTIEPSVSSRIAPAG